MLHPDEYSSGSTAASSGRRGEELNVDELLNIETLKCLLIELSPPDVNTLILPFFHGSSLP